jgi:hypothetical protein
MTSIDKCDPIRIKLKEKNVNTDKYNLCYTKKISLANNIECELCRHDEKNKTFICRPNDADEELISVKNFCKPLLQVKKEELANYYYQPVIDVCKSYKKEYKKSSNNKKKSMRNYK